jgi:hypothetical protein
MPRIHTRILLAAALGLGVVLPSRPADAQQVYLLTTTCSSAASKSVPCTVEAVNVDDTTEYRHQVAGREVAYRVIEDPYVRIEGRKSPDAPWVTVKNAWIDFSTNELCFNNKAFCVVNPTFLADVKADGGRAFEGREQVGLVFNDKGRVDVACFDNGCRRLLEAIGR